MTAVRPPLAEFLVVPGDRALPGGGPALGGVRVHGGGPAWWRLGPLILLVGAATACSAGRREPLVPEDTRERSEERYGEQQQSMQSLNQTPGEQAAAAHEGATRPVKDPGRED